MYSWLVRRGGGRGRLIGRGLECERKTKVYQIEKKRFSWVGCADNFQRCKSCVTNLIDDVRLGGDLDFFSDQTPFPHTSAFI